MSGETSFGEFSDITFVSAYVIPQFEDAKSNSQQTQKERNDFYLAQFTEFAKLNLPCIIFVDPSLTKSWMQILKPFQNITVKKGVSIDQLDVAKQFPRDQTRLPASRNLEKDTWSFLVMINCKIDFVMRAMNDAKTNYLAWIDTGIGKVLKHGWNYALEQIKTIRIPQNKILIPGCHKRNDPHQLISGDQIHWRFCAGLFYGHRNTIKQWDIYNKQELDLAAKDNFVFWEANIWARTEQKHPELFEWYQADHNDTIFSAPSPKKVMLVTMIKNESKIIKRCISSSLWMVDAICVCDTGSTDNTVEILKEWLPTTGKSFRIVHQPWEKSFGGNRTKSFQAGQEFCRDLKWNPVTSYALLLDGDMVAMKHEDAQTKPEQHAWMPHKLTMQGYKVTQRAGNLWYRNPRLLQMSHAWKCHRRTHEYWGDGDANTECDMFYIDDRNDGGCKSDKYTRDYELLKLDLEEMPDDDRSLFYLGNTCRALHKWDEAIEWYKKRIAKDGYFREEVYMSMKYTAECYAEKKDWIEMEYWAQRAHAHCPHRSDSLYLIARKFRELGDNHKAWHYVQKGKSIPFPQQHDCLFIDKWIYDVGFDSERAVLDYYVRPKDHVETLRHLYQLWNRVGYEDLTYTNLHWYCRALPFSFVRTLPIETEVGGDFVATSTSWVRESPAKVVKTNNDHSFSVESKASGGYIVNVRFVNYRIQRDGSYQMYENGHLSGNNPVKTRNFTLSLNKSELFQNHNNLQGETWNAHLEEMEPDALALKSPFREPTVHIRGLEDLRLYWSNSAAADHVSFLLVKRNDNGDGNGDGNANNDAQLADTPNPNPEIAGGEEKTKAMSNEEEQHEKLEQLESKSPPEPKPKNVLRFIATSREWSPDQRIRQVVGTYDRHSWELRDLLTLRPPKGIKNECEKNWIPLGEFSEPEQEDFVYSWHPLRIGRVIPLSDGTGQLEIHTTLPTPKCFEHVRGSSNFVLYQDKLWCITHLVMYSEKPRVYLHQLVQLDLLTKRVLSYSHPFFFETKGIEYCLSLDIQHGQMMSIVSQNDMDPMFICTPLNKVEMITV